MKHHFTAASRFAALSRTAAIAVLAIVVLAGCAKSGSPENETAAESAETAPGSGWYYFSDSGIHAAKSPSDIPARTFVPWTEAVRVSDAAVIDGTPTFLINHLGLMTGASESESSALHTDTALFPGMTAAGIYQTGTGTGIRVYRNSFFADNAAKADPAAGAVCLAGFDTASGTFPVLLTASDLGLSGNAQCVALDRIGSMWYASFKYEKDGKVEFEYLEFASFPARSTDTGSVDLSGIRKISAETYRTSVSPFSYEDAPDPLKSALTRLPAETAFNLKVYSRAAPSAQTYVRAGEGTPVDGSAFVSDERTAVLFADGTVYFSPNNTPDANQVFHLPALSRGYVYTNFILSGTKLVAAWEEQRFYETGRAGLLEITLPDTLY